MAEHYQSGQMSVVNALRRLVCTEDYRQHLHRVLDLTVETELPGAIGAVLAKLHGDGYEEPPEAPNPPDSMPLHWFSPAVPVRSSHPSMRYNCSNVEGAAEELLKWTKRGP